MPAIIAYSLFTLLILVLQTVMHRAILLQSIPHALIAYDEDNDLQTWICFPFHYFAGQSPHLAEGYIYEFYEHILLPTCHAQNVDQPDWPQTLKELQELPLDKASMFMSKTFVIPQGDVAHFAHQLIQRARDHPRFRRAFYVHYKANSDPTTRHDPTNEDECDVATYNAFANWSIDEQGQEATEWEIEVSLDFHSSNADHTYFWSQMASRTAVSHYFPIDDADVQEQLAQADENAATVPSSFACHPKSVVLDMTLVPEFDCRRLTLSTRDIEDILSESVLKPKEPSDTLGPKLHSLIAHVDTLLFHFKRYALMPNATPIYNCCRLTAQVAREDMYDTLTGPLPANDEPWLHQINVRMMW